jgi:galactose mutarotase-like enzyme
LQQILNNEYLQIEVNSRGAELMGVIDKSDGHQYLWQGDPLYWKNRAPVLFPIIGNLTGGKYHFEGREYAMQRHGFASMMDFDLAKTGENAITFALSQDEFTLSQYPFEFRLSVTYILSERTLTTAFQVENTGTQMLWFSIGGHPGLNCGLNAEGRKDCRLIFEKAEKVNRLVNELGYLTGREEPFLQDQRSVDIASLNFDGKTKVYVLKDLRSESLTLEDSGNGKSVRFGFAGFPYLGIWSPSNQAPFLCIEPWYGITGTAGVIDELNHKRGILKVKTGDFFRYGYDMTFDL